MAGLNRFHCRSLQRQMAAPLLRERAVAGLRTLAKRRQGKRPSPLLHISFRAVLSKSRMGANKKFCAMAAIKRLSAIDWFQWMPVNRFDISTI
jgi:hypothetical protein